ncbi:hypothetical protein, partial [Faecalibaculum rodentium]|uniref:hypothetical protein n=1 Tax=Faecalibaculum rodentium TaxID=1702221 RepID=UPI0026F348C6
VMDLCPLCVFEDTGRQGSGGRLSGDIGQKRDESGRWGVRGGMPPSGKKTPGSRTVQLPPSSGRP